MKWYGACATTLGLFLISTLSLSAQEEPTAIILEQGNAPIAITKYEAQSNERAIRHELEYRNNTQRGIRAVRFGLLSFNIFNEFIERFGGYTMDSLEPNGDDDGAWTSRASSAPSFFTGIAYVAKLRFMDGEIWSAEGDSVGAKVQQIIEDFDASQLDESDEPDE